MYKIKKNKDIRLILDSSGNYLNFEGSLGNIQMKLNHPLKFSCNEDFYIFENDFLNKSLMKTYISLIQLNCKGVSQGFKKQMLLKGVGFKCYHLENKLKFDLGFSHSILIIIPDKIDITVTNKNTFLTVRSIDYKVLNQFCFNIQRLKKPEIYKGKGIVFKNQNIRLKEGKKSKK